MISDESWIAQCIAFAARALNDGEVPVVAIAVQGDNVIGKGVSGCSNGLSQRSHFWNHAEILALLDAERSLKSLVTPLVLYTTLEPCLMCLGAAANVGVQRIVFAYPAKPDGAAWITKLVPRPSESPSLLVMPRLHGPVAPAQMQELFTTFLAAFPQHEAVDYVRSIVSTVYINAPSRSPPDSAVFDAYFEGASWTFGNAPTKLVHRLCGFLKKNSSILEIGAGDGRDTLHLAQLGHSVSALDISPVAIRKIAERSANQPKLKVQTFLGDVTELRSWQVAFDAVVGITVVDHIVEDDLENVLDAIWKLLSDGGRVALQVHTRGDPGFLKHLDASETSQWVRHYFRKDELRRRLVHRYEIEFYCEWVEADYDHGPPHEHAFAGVIAKKRPTSTNAPM